MERIINKIMKLKTKNMKRLFVAFLFISGFIFSSCNEDKTAVNAVADELCEAMAIFNVKDTTTYKLAADKIKKVAENADYESIKNVSELDSVMKKKCPEGFIKYKVLGEIFASKKEE